MKEILEVEVSVCRSCKTDQTFGEHINELCLQGWNPVWNTFQRSINIEGYVEDTYYYLIMEREVQA